VDILPPLLDPAVTVFFRSAVCARLHPGVGSQTEHGSRSRTDLVIDLAAINRRPVGSAGRPVPRRVSSLETGSLLSTPPVSRPRSSPRAELLSPALSPASGCPTATALQTRCCCSSSHDLQPRRCCTPPMTEVCIRVKENLSGNFASSFGPHSTVTDCWQFGPIWRGHNGPFAHCN
jgi:hypothetical protein